MKIIKPKNARSRRALEKKEPKVVENIKSAILVKGTKTSQIVNDAMSDLGALKKPYVVSFNKKNDAHPFDDVSPLEFFSQKNDASLIVFGSHSKKRPHHLTFGRTYDGRILDMVELQIAQYLPMKSFNSSGCGVGQKPLFLFSGADFEQNEELKTLKSILLDFYRGVTLEQVSLNGLEHVVSVTATETKIFFRVYNVLLKKSGARVPRVELSEMGPAIDFAVDRVRLPDYGVLKHAMSVPKVLKPQNVKNISRDDAGDKFGRIHLGRQDFQKLQTRKMKGLKRWSDTGAVAEVTE